MLIAVSFSTEKCSCPKEITTNSYNYAPYSRFISSYGSNGAAVYSGIFFATLTKMMAQCCGNCSGGHGPSSIKWEDEPVLKTKSMSLMKNNVGNYDLSFPIEGSKTSEYYRSVLMTIGDFLSDLYEYIICWKFTRKYQDLIAFT